MVDLYVCLCVCVLVTFASPAKTAETIEMPFVGLEDHLLDGSSWDIICCFYFFVFDGRYRCRFPLLNG